MEGGKKKEVKPTQKISSSEKDDAKEAKKKKEKKERTYIYVANYNKGDGQTGFSRIIHLHDNCDPFDDEQVKAWVLESDIMSESLLSYKNGEPASLYIHRITVEKVRSFYCMRKNVLLILLCTCRNWTRKKCLKETTNTI